MQKNFINKIRSSATMSWSIKLHENQLISDNHSQHLQIIRKEFQSHNKEQNLTDKIVDLVMK